MLTWLLYNALLCLPLFLLAGLLLRARRIRPSTAHLIWVLLLLRLIAPPFPGWVLGGDGGASGANPQALLLDSSTGAFQREVVAWMSTHFGSNWSAGLFQGLTAIWAAGFLFVLAREWRHARALRSALRGTREVSASTRARVAELAEELGVRAPALHCLPSIASPFLWSPLWPAKGGVMMVLPAAHEDLPRSVLAHELLHLRRRDHWTSRVEVLALALFWWNPLAWFLRRRVQLAAELACDAEVLRHLPGERVDYARALVETLERDQQIDRRLRPVAASRAIGWRAEELTHRLERILRDGVDRQRTGLWPLVLAAALTLTLPGIGAPSVAQFEQALPSIPNSLPESRCAEMLEEADLGLRLAPRDGALHMQRGRALMGLRRFEDAAKAFEVQVALAHRPELAAYNAACARSLAGDKARAIEHLTRALQAGISPEYLAHDRDLDPLREEAGFRALLPPPSEMKPSEMK